MKKLGCPTSRRFCETWESQLRTAPEPQQKSPAAAELEAIQITQLKAKLRTYATCALGHRGKQPEHPSAHTRHSDRHNQSLSPDQTHYKSRQQAIQSSSRPRILPGNLVGDSGATPPICSRQIQHRHPPQENCRRYQHQSQQRRSSAPADRFATPGCEKAHPSINQRHRRKKNENRRRNVHTRNSLRATSAMRGISAATAIRILSSSIMLSAN